MEPLSLTTPTHVFQWAMWRVRRVKSDAALLHLDLAHGTWPSYQKMLIDQLRGLGIRANRNSPGRLLIWRPIDVARFLLAVTGRTGAGAEIRAAALEYQETWRVRLSVNKGEHVSVDLRMTTERAALRVLRTVSAEIPSVDAE